MSNFAESTLSNFSAKMVTKTRDKLIEVARQLFVNKGVEHTTMNDIALASEKGRRTIYTYFKSKREILDAVVENQSNQVIDTLLAAVNSDMPYEQKLRKYLQLRFDIVDQRDIKPRSPHVRMWLPFATRTAGKKNLVYDKAIDKERELFARFLNDGVKAGAFSEEQVSRLPMLIKLAFYFIDYGHVYGHVPLELIGDKNLRDNFVEFVVKAITINQSI